MASSRSDSTSHDALPSDKFTSQLPPRLNANAPVGAAKIVSRSAPESGVVSYTLEIGSVSVPNVSALEIFDYISPHDLEVFENSLFEIETIAQTAAEEARLEAVKVRRRGRPRRDETSPRSSRSSARDDDSGSNVSFSGNDNATTGSGSRRPRPTYTQFYPKQRASRGSSKQSHSVQVVVPVSSQASIKPGPLESNAASPATSSKREFKRQKRNHDSPVSASPGAPESVYSIGSLEEPTHAHTQPSTMEVAAGIVASHDDNFDPMDMDEDDDDDEDEETSDSVTTSMPSATAARGASIPVSVKNLAISAKKPASVFGKDTTSKTPSMSVSVSSKDSSRHGSVIATKESKPPTSSAKSKLNAIPNKAPTAPVKSAASLLLARGNQNRVSVPSTKTTGTTSTTDPKQSSAAAGPSPANVTPAIHDPADDDSDEESDTYSVEKILGHQLSDPRSHGASHGTQPVMLYHVKWEGYDELTWEPAESFEDDALLSEYWEQQRRKGMQRATPRG